MGTINGNSLTFGEPFRRTIMELHSLEDAGQTTAHLLSSLRDMVLEQHARVGAAPLPEVDWEGGSRSNPQDNKENLEPDDGELEEQDKPWYTTLVHTYL